MADVLARPSSSTLYDRAMPMPRVSIVVSHYDRQSLLLEALDSIASQTYRDFELVVVNDHGADSRTLVEDFAERAANATSPFSVRYDYRPANAGVAATRNRGVELARGELIAYLDDDDLWSPAHLEGLVGLLDARPEVGLVYGDAEICQMAMVQAAAAGGPSWRRADTRILAVPFDLVELRCDDFIVPGGMVHRRSLYDVVGPFDETLSVSDDWDWLLRASAVATFARLPRVVITVRMWPDRGNRSARFDDRRLAALAEIERRHGTPPLEPKTFWEVAEKHGRGAEPPPGRLLELATAYQRSRVLLAMVQLDVASWLASGARSLADINTRLGADPIVAERFVHACVALGLLVRDGDRFANAADTQRYLVRGTPTYLGDVLVRDDRVSRLPEWAEFTERLRSWREGAAASSMSMQRAPVGAELEGQHRLSLLAGEALGRALDLSGKQRLLDLGGGTGAMSIALCRRFSRLEAIVVERPEIVPLAETHVRESRLARIQVREGDFMSDPLPGACDVVLLANVLSMSSAETNRALIARLFDDLPAGGMLVLSGWMLDANRMGPLLPLLFCFEDVVLRAPDVERSAVEYAAWLTAAGFVRIGWARYHEPLTYVVGWKP